MQWRIEGSTGDPICIEGTLDDAFAVAQQHRNVGQGVITIWLVPANIRIAQISSRGHIHTRRKLTGEELRRLMRRGRKTIADLSFQMEITQKRIRVVRESGLDDGHAVRDWIEAITASDIGPLPDKYRIRHHTEEATCGNCGCPLYVGDEAFEFVGGAYCSFVCCRKACGFEREGSVVPGKIRLGCQQCDRDDFDGVDRLPKDWDEIEEVRSLEEARTPITADDSTRSVFDWQTHLGVCPKCQATHR